MKSVCILVFCFWVTAGQYARAQSAHFTTSGTIEFDKNVNMYALINKRINKDNESFMQTAFEAYKKSNPQMKVLKSTLTFADNKTLFTPKAEEEMSNSFFGDEPMATQNNIVYTDLNTDKKISQKKVFEQTFLVTESPRKINWKITDETRDIAGYTCRRANAIIMDSVYVVAFYTNEITVSGGPESFSGLPGMILGVALPHDNVSWFATKVIDSTLPPSAVAPPKKGKPVDDKGFMTTLKAAFKDWGNYAQYFSKVFSL